MPRHRQAAPTQVKHHSRIQEPDVTGSPLLQWERSVVQWFPWGGRGLKGDEVDQVALGWGHAFWKEVDEGVEKLRPLSVGLVDI